MASQKEDFESLMIPPEDYNLLLPKVRDVGKLMRKRASFAIKFITYLLFRFEGQKGLHNPVSDCHLTMLSYLYDYEYLEDEMKRAKERCPTPSRKNYLSYIIPPNLKMSNLVKKFSDEYKSWPRRPLNKYQY